MISEPFNITTIRYFLTLLFFLLFDLLPLNKTYAAADCFWLDNALEGPLHKKECVLEKEDITDANGLLPVNFWKRIEKYASRPVSMQPDSRIMENRLFQIYFFGNFSYHLVKSDSRAIESAAYLQSLSDSKDSGLLGRPVSAKKGSYVVADDIPFEPILSGHGHYSNKYYPRRMGDYALTFLEGFYLTENVNYKNRFFNMIDYLIYSQFRKDGSNEFIRKFCSKGDSDCLPLDKRLDAAVWKGGFDFNFDFEWKDAYGYKWQLHEPDHHVNAINAVALVKGFELSNDKKYLNAAYDFVYNQIPRYGYHTGIWNNKRYYWTEYNPSGKNNPMEDTVDNVQSLVAHAVAMVGYYTENQVMLEFARGLLWYNLREFRMDSRWFYDGAESKINARKAVSHDSAVLRSAIETLPYLIKSGMDVRDLVNGYYDAFIQYLHYNDPSVNRMSWNVGSVGTKKSKDFPTDLAHLSPIRVRGWKTFSKKPKTNQTVRITYYFQINDKEILQKKDKLILLDRFLRNLEPGTEISISRYSVVSGLHENVSKLIVSQKKDKLFDLFSKYPQVQMGDILSLSFNWIPVLATALNYEEPYFILLERNAQGEQKLVKSMMLALDPEAGCSTDLFEKFPKKYFMPR